MTRAVAVLRPEPGNAATAARLAELGLHAVRLPLFAVQPVAWDVPDAAAHDALVLTSANALRHGGAGLARLKALPVFAVGAATAQAARAARFTVVAEARGGVAELAGLLGDHGVRAGLHLAGLDRIDAPGTRISAVRTVYASDPVSVEAAALRSLRGAVALLHSPRAARRFASLADAHHLPRGSVAIAAISPAVLDAAGAGWESAVAADSPDDAALVALARRLAGD